jgi:hypothetical protein
MKPENKIVLVSPATDEVQGGPDPAWFEQLESNLDLVLKKYADTGHQSITPESKNALEILGNAGVLIPVWHDSYHASGKYIRFLEKFLAEAGDKSPSLVLLNTSPKKEKMSTALPPDAASVEMYEISSGQVRLIGEESGTYWSRLLDLAAEIKAIRSTGPGPGETDKTVYLAQASGDMSLNREIMKRELVEYGYGVVPVSDLSGHKADLKSHIQNLADKSMLAIHLLGNAYGEVMKETGLSLAETQVQYIGSYLEAIENEPVHARKELSRLIWIDSEFNPRDQAQEEFINRLKQNIENLHRTEIIQTPLELFKTLVINKIQKSHVVAPPAGEEKPAGGFIYLIHSPDDQKEAGELSAGMEKRGLKTSMLDYERDQGSLLNHHKHFLRECAGAVIYYGRPKRQWLRSKVMDLLKAPGLGRDHALQTRQVLAAQTDLLEDYSPPQGISVIREPDLSEALVRIVKNMNQ